MDDAKGLMIAIAKGLALSAAYCIAYLVLRYFSFDQWFLPTGLRAVCFFFLPIRHWPAIFIGDAAAVMSGRISIANENSNTWVYFGPIALISSVSIAPILIRKKIPTTKALRRWLPLIAAIFAAWSGMCTVSLNGLLGGPDDNATISFLVNKFFGNFLGTLMLMLPFLIYQDKDQYKNINQKTIRDILITALTVSCMFVYLKNNLIEDDLEKKTTLILMICPALFLTYYHGWLGAAIGVLVVNLGIAQTITYTGIPGTHDDTVFLVQIGFSIAASAFLTLGSRITTHYYEAINAGVAEEEAKKISRLTLLSNEGVLRDQVLYMAQLQILLDEERSDLVGWLKYQGKHQEALALNNNGMRQRQVFNEHALALYPIGIEEKGLFAVVQSQAFEDFWATGTNISFRFDNGQPRKVSVELQVAAYRCLCSAIVLMCDWKPEELHVRMRVWTTSLHRGIYFSVDAFNPGQAEISQAGTAASLLLNARASTHGGLVRRHAHRISAFLSEKPSAPSEQPAHSPGLITHLS